MGQASEENVRIRLAQTGWADHELRDHRLRLHSHHFTALLSYSCAFVLVCAPALMPGGSLVRLLVSLPAVQAPQWQRTRPTLDPHSERPSSCRAPSVPRMLALALVHTHARAREAHTRARVYDDTGNRTHTHARANATRPLRTHTMCANRPVNHSSSH